MIQYDKELARVSGTLSHEDVSLEILLTRGVITRGEISERTARKKLLVNGAGKRFLDFASHFSVVVFRPQDIELVTESPSVRRKFMDCVLSQVDHEYRRCILTYEKGVTRRNKILFRIREEGLLRQNLYFWDKLLIKNGEYITRKREELISFINDSPELDDKDFDLDYDKSIISESRLMEYKSEEVAAATTLVGPHRDDVIFKIKNNSAFVELDKYGSRGEQRMGVLWVKLAELSFLRERSESRPTLLLGDIFLLLD